MQLTLLLLLLLSFASGVAVAVAALVRWGLATGLKALARTGSSSAATPTHTAASAQTLIRLSLVSRFLLSCNK
jgi:hypothetical protein